MKTKALLLTVALGAASAATSIAQVYSQNAVGYINIALSGGKFQMIGNQLITADAKLSTVLPAPPDGTLLYLFVGGNFQIKTFDIASSGGWDDPAALLPVGSGAFIRPPNGSGETTITLVGEVPQGTPVSNPLPGGYSIKASKVPQAGGLTTVLGLTNPNDGDRVYQFDKVIQNFSIHTYDVAGSGGWDVEPNIAVAESFFYFSFNPAGVTWNRNFVVN